MSVQPLADSLSPTFRNWSETELSSVREVFGRMNVAIRTCCDRSTLVRRTSPRKTWSNNSTPFHGSEHLPCEGTTFAATATSPARRFDSPGGAHGPHLFGVGSGGWRRSLCGEQVFVQRDHAGRDAIPGIGTADLLVGRLPPRAALSCIVDHLDEGGGERGLVVGVDEPAVRTSGGCVHEGEGPRAHRPR
jgi:hypothetical protein